MVLQPGRDLPVPGSLLVLGEDGVEVAPSFHELLVGHVGLPALHDHGLIAARQGIGCFCATHAPNAGRANSGQERCAPPTQARRGRSRSGHESEPDVDRDCLRTGACAPLLGALAGMGLVTNLDTMPLFCSGARKPRHRLASDHPRPPEDRSWLSACAIPSVSETDPTDLVSHQGASQFRRGTLRAGGAMRVSPVGLASWRSRSVKARITSAASKARFRLPTVVCERTLAPTIRVMASLAAWVLRPISSAALATVEESVRQATGAAKDRPQSWPERVRGVLARSPREPRCAPEGGGVGHRSPRGRSE